MTGSSALVVHHDPDTLETIRQILDRGGLEVLCAGSDRRAIEHLGSADGFLPDVLLTSLDGDGVPPIVRHLRSNPLTERVPLIVLANGDPGERRRALRLGTTHLVPAPFDPEEVELTVRLALEQRSDEDLLAGSLDQLPLPDLLQTFEASRKTGLVLLRAGARHGTLWLRAGKVIDARIDGGPRGRDAALEMMLWEHGSFEADFGPIEAPERIEESTSHLLLEAMRRRDEAARQLETPPHAALPDPPPQPPRELRTAHRALTLLNVAAAYASDHMDRTLLAERLESPRGELEAEHPILADFRVGADAKVTLAGDATGIDPAPLVPAVARWLRRFFAGMERALPGRFQIRKLKALTEAVQDDLEDLGFYTALGLSSDSADDFSEEKV